MKISGKHYESIAGIMQDENAKETMKIMYNATTQGNLMGKITLENFRPILPELENAFYYQNDKRTTSNIYLFKDREKTMVVDAGDGVDTLDFAPSVCFLTHCHFDHAQGVEPNWPLVYIHPDADASLPYIHIPKNAVPIPSTSFDFGKFHFEIIPTPGHTPDCMCLYETRNKILLSGDTLFAGGVHGRTDIGGPNSEKLMQESLSILSHIEWKVLCPGHGELEFSE